MCGETQKGSREPLGREESASGVSFSENLVFLKDFIGFSWFWGGPREFPESSRGAQVAPGSVPASPFGPPGALDGVQELLERSKVGPRSSKSSPKEQKVGLEGP